MERRGIRQMSIEKAGHMNELQRQFVDFCFLGIKTRKEELQSDLNERERKIREFSSSIAKEWRQITLLRKEMKLLEDELNRSESQYLEELSHILANPLVKAISFPYANAMNLYTHPITIEHGDQKYLVGEFAIEIYFEGYIKIRNLNNPGRYTYYDHPHIRDGEPCFGNISDVFGKLIAECNFSVLANLVIAYLQKYTEGDAYCEVAYWPNVEV